MDELENNNGANHTARVSRDGPPLHAMMNDREIEVENHLRRQSFSAKLLHEQTNRRSSHDTKLSKKLKMKKDANL